MWLYWSISLIVWMSTIRYIEESSIYLEAMTNLHINRFIQNAQGCQGGTHRIIDPEGYKVTEIKETSCRL